MDSRWALPPKTRRACYRFFVSQVRITGEMAGVASKVFKTFGGIVNISQNVLIYGCAPQIGSNCYWEHMNRHVIAICDTSEHYQQRTALARRFFR